LNLKQDGYEREPLSIELQAMHTRGCVVRTKVSRMALQIRDTLMCILTPFCVGRQKQKTPWRSRIEFGIPVQIVEPTVAQIVGREQPAVTVNLTYGRCDRRLLTRFLWKTDVNTKLPRPIKAGVNSCESESVLLRTDTH
jgi:hypothetical protein